MVGGGGGAVVVVVASSLVLTVTLVDADRRSRVETVVPAGTVVVVVVLVVVVVVVDGRGTVVEGPTVTGSVIGAGRDASSGLAAMATTPSPAIVATITMVRRRRRCIEMW